MTAQPAPAPRRTRRVVRALVGIVAIACLAWVLAPVVLGFDQILASRRMGPLLAAIVVGALGYALLDALLAAAWTVLARIYGEGAGGRPGLVAGYVVFALSQWSKYLPGNVLQYVSRQALGRRAGWSHGALAQSGLLELASLVVAAALTGGLALALSGEVVEGLPPWGAILGVVLALALAPWALDRLARRTRPGRRLLDGLAPVSPERSVRLLAVAVPLHGLFFAGAGAVLVALVRWGWGAPEPGAGLLVGLYAAAWLAGTFAFGAPAGAGVREAILALGLEPALGALGASTVALALRLVTVGGDLLMAGSGLLVRARLEPAGQAGAGEDASSTTRS